MKSKDHMGKEMKEKVQLFVTGELDENENKAVFDWISSSPKNLRYYNGLSATLSAAEYFRTNNKYDIERVRSRLNKRIELSGEGRKTDFRILFRVAASLLLLVTVSMVLLGIKDHRTEHAEAVIYNTIESPFGSRAQVYLPDSTHVVLNAGSTLRYPVNFMDTRHREVLLSGEGFFEVRKSKRSQFVVRVGDIEITALGTAFNVKAYPEEALIEATLVEGLLRINRGENQKETIILRPNEKVSIIKQEDGILREPAGPATVKKAVIAHPQTIPIKEVYVEKRIDPITDISWKDREWVIQGKTMKELSVLLERRYDIEIVLGDGKVGNFRFSGTLKDETMEQVLYAIRTTAPIDYKTDGNRIVLSENKTLRKQYENMLKGSSR